jgi:DNA-directed RNA polymerase subunit RPC12/RpoP
VRSYLVRSRGSSGSADDPSTIFGAAAPEEDNEDDELDGMEPATGVAPPGMAAGPCLGSFDGLGAIPEGAERTAQREQPRYLCCACGHPRVIEDVGPTASACAQCQHRVFRKEPVRRAVSYSTD